MQIGIAYSANAFGKTIGVTKFARLAEARGFDSFWLADVVSSKELDPLTALAAVAQTTKNIRLGTTVIALPLRHPIQLAKQALTTNLLSGGRLILGVGAGAIPKDFEVLQVNYHRRGKITDEALKILRHLTTQADVSHQGACWQFENLTVEPRPSHSIPIWLGTYWNNGFADVMLSRTAQYCDGFFPVDAPAASFTETRDNIQQRAGDLGRGSDSFTWAAWMAVSVGSKREDALTAAHQEIKRRYGITDPMDPTRHLIGSVSDCIDTIGEYERAGVTHLVLAMMSPPEKVMEQFEIVANEILPEVGKVGSKRSR